VAVGRAAVRHQCVHIGDADQDAEIAIGEPLDEFDLVEVAGFGVIDGRPEQGSQILDAGSGFARRRTDGADLAQDVGGKVRLESLPDHFLMGGLPKIDWNGHALLRLQISRFHYTIRRYAQPRILTWQSPRAGPPHGRP
jgi:hypothetical protein